MSEFEMQKEVKPFDAMEKIRQLGQSIFNIFPIEAPKFMSNHYNREHFVEEPKIAQPTLWD